MNEPTRESKSCSAVRVSWSSTVLGTGVLEHPDNTPADEFAVADIDRIFNLVARIMAYNVADDGKERHMGMWTVTPIFKPPVAEPNAIVEARGK